MPKLYIKNMVCDRCKAAVKKNLDDLKFQYSNVELGEVDVTNEISNTQLNSFREALEAQGFELIETREARIVSQIKKLITERVRAGNQGKIKLSAYLADQLHKDYTALSKMFSEVESSTIEQYFVHQKIEFVKELLVYDELSLTEIADRLGYSSVSHLSNQFKKVTGLTTKHFRTIGAEKRIAIDKV